MLASPPGGLYRARKFLRRQDRGPRHRRRARAIVLSGVTVWSLDHRDSSANPRFPKSGPMVLADFANATGDPTFDATLRQALAAQLGNSPNLACFPMRA